MAAWVVLAVSSCASVGGDEFNDAFHSIQQDHFNQSRVESIRASEALLERFADHPRAAEVMLYIASRFEGRDPAKGIEANPAEAIRWYRKAMSAAKPGTEAWAHSRLWLANRIRYSQDERERAEAIQLLDEVEAAGVNDFWLSSVERSRIQMAGDAGDFNAMKLHFEQFLKIAQEGENPPDDPHEARTITSSVPGLARSYVHSVAVSELPVAERVERITTFRDEHEDAIDGLWTDANKALALTKSLPATTLTEIDIGEPLDATGGTRRLWIIGGNVAFIGAVLLVLAIRQYRSGKT